MMDILIVVIIASTLLAIIAIEMYASSKRKCGENHKDIFRGDER